MSEGQEGNGRRRHSDGPGGGRPARDTHVCVPEPAAAAADGSSFTETIDRRTGSIRARGRLTLQAADMLSGTVEALCRSGQARIVLDLGGVRAVDDAGLHAIRSLQDRIRAAGGQVTVIDLPVGDQG